MGLSEQDWHIILTRLKQGTCTPFLGAAVNYGILPLGGAIAKTWAERYEYPLDSRSDLAKVAQFLGIKFDPTQPKELMRQELAQSQKAFSFADDTEPINVLAKLPLPLYITTNYDDLLYSAIEHHGHLSNRRPTIELCKWNRSPTFQPSVLRRGSKFKPTRDTPLIYHLHGHRSVVDSLVLTEDDYLDFLVNMSKDLDAFLPPRIQEALTASSLLFIGYSLADIDFRVLFRGLRGNLETALGKMSVAVQLPYDDTHPNKSKAEEYISHYFGSINVRVFWGTAQQFASELWQRWKKFDE
jgi:hypothetical protein